MSNYCIVRTIKKFNQKICLNHHRIIERINKKSIVLIYSVLSITFMRHYQHF